MKKAFSLIELLVVVAILTVSLAIILPVLNQSRRTAQKATCASNLKTIGVTLRMYADDNDGTWPDAVAWDYWSDIWRQPFPVCPSAPSKNAPPKWTNIITGYAYNGALITANSHPLSKHQDGSGSARDRDIPFPSVTVAVCDSVNEVTITQAPDPFRYISPRPYGTERSWERHNGGANYLFCDGHVNWHRAEEVLPAIPPLNDGTQPTFALITKRKP